MRDVAGWCKRLLFSPRCRSLRAEARRWAALVLLALASPAPAQTFTDVTATWGVGDSPNSLGAAWGDYDGDGDLDLYVVFSGGASNILYANTGSAFTASGEADAAGFHTGAAWGDYDGDGDLDLYVVDGGGSDLLYRNSGAAFADVAAAAGVQNGGVHSPGWIDYDRDGDLDLYVADNGGANTLFQNDGTGVFSDAASAAGVAHGGDTEGATWADYDADGWPDLYIANNTGANVLYQNDGDGTFTDVTTAAGVGAGNQAIAGSWADYDADGDFDLHVVYNKAGTADALYQNDGDGTFADVAAAAGVANTSKAVSSVWGDFDADGDLDLYVGNGAAANLLYGNGGGGTFTEGAAYAGVADAGDARAVTAADFDGDGDLDLFVVNASKKNKLFSNDGGANKWLKVELTGGGDNSAAIGALAIAWTGGSSQRRQVEGASTWNGQNSLELEFGFGATATVDSLIVRWPSGQKSKVVGQATNVTLALSEPALTVFSEEAATAGVADGGSGQGASWADYDGDGDLDLYSADQTGGTGSTDRLYQNNNDGTFTESATAAGIGATGSTRSAVWADYDGDGDLDLFLSQSGANLLYANDGDGTFTERASSAGVAGSDDSYGASWADYDLDGDLDLYVAHFSGAALANVLYANDGDGTFTNVAASAGATDGGSGMGVAWADFDGDGWPDLYLANAGSANKLFRNDQDGTFTEVAVAAGVADGSSTARGASWADFDNDGDFDLYVTTSASANRLFVNNGDGTFVDRATAAGVADGSSTARGAGWADFDNDGDLDLYVANQSSANRLFLNRGDGGFDEVGAAAGTADPGQSAGMSWGDYDGDGDLDLYVNNSGTSRLFDNQGNANKWLRVELGGRSSDSYGIGAVVTAEAGATSQKRHVDGGSGFMSQPSQFAHFGFGNLAGTIDKVLVVWSSGFSSVSASVATNQELSISERSVVSLAPPLDENNAARSAVVTATFSAAVTGVDLNTFIVHGSQTGEYSGTYAGEGTPTISLDPTDDFLPGEEIEVRFADGTSAGLLTYRGTPVAPYVYEFTAAAGSGPAEFSSVFSTPFSSSTQAVELGDVDGDGDLDLVAGTAAQNAVYLNDGEGLMVAGTNNFGSGSDNTTSVDLADVDGDGDLDIVAASFGGQNTTHLNDGSGAFAASANFGTGADATRPLVLADLDGDGFADVAVGNDGGQNVVYFNDGAGAFTAGAVNFGTGTDATRGLDIGDADNDGDLDLFAGNHNEANKVYLNDGWGSFTAGNTFGSGSEPSHGIAVGDIDGDGDADVLNASLGGQSRPELNDGTGTFAAGAAFGPTANARAVELGDVDGDGDLDAALGFDSGTTSDVYLNDGAGAFSAGARVFAGTAAQTMAVALGDIDGDLDLDVVAGNDGTFAEVHFNSAAPSLSSISPTAAFASASSAGNVTATFSKAVSGGNAGSFAVYGSMTGKIAGTYGGNNSTTLSFDPTDNFFPGETVFSTLTTAIESVGGIELVGPHVWGFRIATAVSVPAFSTGNSTSFGTGSDDTRALAVGDVDGDGDLDLAVGNGGGQQNKVYLNAGNGAFTSSSALGGSDTRAALLADFDGDGDLDAAIGDESGQDQVWFNDGAGTFSSSANFGTGSERTRHLAAGDMNGDGSLDIVSAAWTEQNEVYFNDGNGAFASSSPFGATTDASTWSGLGDFDGDGDVDIALANGGGQQNRVYLNDGWGGFSTYAAFGTGSDESYVAQPFDFDGDGDVDIALANGGGQQNRVYLNDGWGGFAGSVSFGPGGDDSWALDVGDVDGDGDLDLAVGNDQQSNAVYLNDGSGFAGTPLAFGTAADAARFVLLADFDGDGDLDIAAADDGMGNFLYFNGPGPGAAFVDAAAGAGVDDVDQGVASGWGDYDGDGDLDLYVTNNGQANVFYRNDGGTFAEVGSALGMADSGSGRSATWIDFDEDGDLDLYVANTGSANVLYRNDGGAFSISGALADASRTQIGTWADWDRDGDLDVFLSNYGDPDRLYRNDGDGRFAEVAAALGVADAGNGQGAAWADYDGDGDLDLCQVRDNQVPHLYRNDGGAFAEVAAASGLSAFARDQGISWADYDGDGDFDFAVTVSDAANRLYRNDGATFAEVAAGAGVADAGSSSGLGWADYDNDGDFDLLVVNSGAPSRLEQNGGGSFADVAPAAGIDLIIAGGGISWADYDGDGDVDLYVAFNGNNRLYQNQGNANHWLRLGLASAKSHRSAIGAVAAVWSGGEGQWQQVASTHGSRDQGSRRLQFGLGTAAQADSVVVHWPQGPRQVLGVQTADQSLSLTQPLTGTTAATGPAGIVEAPRLGEVEIWRAGLTGDGVASVQSVALTLSDLSAPTGLSAGDIAGLKLYASEDAHLDGADSLLGTQAVAIGTATTVTAATPHVPPDGQQHFYLVSALIDSNAAAGHAFRVAAGPGHIASAAGALGRPLAASDSQAVFVQSGVRAWPDDDRDGDVDFSDFLALSSAYGTASGASNFNGRLDLDGDGRIGFGDWLIFSRNFGRSGLAISALPSSGAGSSAAAVPALDLSVGNQTDEAVHSGTHGGAGSSLVVQVFAKGLTAAIRGAHIDFAIDTAKVKVSGKSPASGLGSLSVHTDTSVQVGALSPAVVPPGQGLLADVTFAVRANSDFTIGIKRLVLGDSSGRLDTLSLGGVAAVSTAYAPAGISESVAAAGLSGASTRQPSTEAQIFSIGLTGDGVASVDSIALTLSDLSAATGLSAADFAGLCVYRSTDAVWDQGDALLGTQATVAIGAPTTIALNSPDLIAAGAQSYYLVTAKIAAAPTDGHAFRVGFAAGGVSTTSGGVGTAVAASDGDKITIDVVATQLVFTTQPAGAVHAAPLATQPVVQAQDASGNLDRDQSGTVTLTASAGTLDNGAASMSGGIATFGGLAVRGASSGATLTAALSGLSAATSNSFVVAAAPVAFALSNMQQAYDGQGKAITVTTNPPGVAFSVLYDGAATPPVGPGTFAVTVTAADPNFVGSSTGQFTITGPPPPVAQLRATPTAGNAPLQVRFDDTSTGTISSSALMTGQGDETLSNISSATVTYAAGGTYTAVLTVTGPGGSASTSVTIAVQGPPQLGTIAGATGKEDEAIVLDLSGVDAQSGTWSVADADTALIASVSISGDRITFAPVADRSGSDVVTITRTGPTGLAASRSVTLTWAPVDDPPLFVGLPGTASAPEDSAIAVGGAAFVGDIDSDVGTFEWWADNVDAGLVASASGGRDGVRFVPVENASGQSTATLHVRDPATGQEISQDITLTWVPVNDPPAKPLVARPADGATEVPLATVLSWSAADVDGDALKFDVFLGPEGAEEQVAAQQEESRFSAVGLEPGQTYGWRVVARDPSGATSATAARFTTEADRQPPRISMLRATPVDDGARIIWETDEPASFVLDYRSAPDGAAEGVDSGRRADTLRVRQFEVALSALRAATWYDFSVRARDRFGNESPPASGRFRTLAAPDTVRPVIAPGSLVVNGITQEGAWVRWRTDELSSGTVRYFAEGAAKRAQLGPDDSGRAQELVLRRGHAVELSGLRAATQYRIAVESTDASGNVSLPAEGRFATAAAADEVAPRFTRGPGARAQVERADIEVAADEVVSVEISYDSDDTPEDGRVAAGGDPAVEHRVALEGLRAGTAYSYQVKITDVGGNSTLSDVLGFETRAAPDTTAPRAEGWRVVASSARAVLDFGFDEPVTAAVSWWPLSAPEQVFFADVVEAQRRHRLTLANLEAATDYAYAIAASDEAGNAAAPIADQFTTEAAPDTAAPVVLNALVNARRLEGVVLLVELDEAAVLKGELVLVGLPAGVEAGGATIGERRAIGQAELRERHRVALTQLLPGADYQVEFTAIDPHGNGRSGQVAFRAPLRRDTEPPQLTRRPAVSSVDEASARLGVAYNEDVQLEVRYYPAADPAAAETRSFTQPQQEHAFELNGLRSGAEYAVELEARDAANLLDRQSLRFFTLAERDTLPPVFTKLPWVEDAQLTSVRLRFELDEPAVAELELVDGADPQQLFRSSVVERRQAHALEVTGLRPGATYAYVVRVADANRNQATARGQVRTIEQVVPPRIVAGPTRQRIDADRAWIALSTNVPARIAIDYFLESAPGDVQSEQPSGRGKEHVVQLTNLLPDTTYGFTAVAIDDKAKLRSAPVSGSFRTARGPDVVAPQIQGAPAATSIADRRAKIVWSTDEPADSEVRLQGPQGARIFAEPTPVLRHEVELTNLLPESKYTYSVASTDLAGNSSASATFGFSTLAAPDTLPPQFARRPIVRSTSHNSVVIAYSADEPASSTVDVGTSAAYELGTRTIAEQVLDHEVRIDGLAAATRYLLRVGLTDALGNGPTYFPALEVTTDAAPDTTPPQILTGPFVPPPTESEAIVEWTTDEPATRQVRYWKKEEPGEVFFREEGTLELRHRLVLSNLEAGTFYQYVVSSADEARNGPVESSVGEFRTQARPQPPAFVAGPVAEADESSATITWTTNVPANSIVDLGVDLDYGMHVEQAELVQDHEVLIENLEPGTEYHYKVTSIDLAGHVLSTDPAGLELHSRDLVVRTPGAADEEPPRLLANPTTVWTDRSVVVSWQTDEASTSRIEWQNLGTGESGFVEDNQMVFEHSLTLTGLEPRTLYAVKVVSEDAAGNRMVWEPTAAAKQAAKRAFDRGLRTLAAGKVAQPPGGAGTFVTDSFPDTRFPVITSGPRVREKTAESITIEWQTDELADSFVRFGSREAALEEIVGQPQDVQVHSITLTNLEAGARYFFQVESTDPSGNGATVSAVAVATTAAGADLAPPRYVREPELVATTDVQATLSWQSDEAASASIEYWHEGGDVLVRQVRQRQLEQQVTLTNLRPATAYRALISLRDANLNETETPFELRFQTDAEPDRTAPRLLGEPRVEALGDRSATIVWQTDELADSFVDYDSSPYLGQVAGDPTYATEHAVRLTHLLPGTTYFFQVGSSDRAENGPALSAVHSFTTLSEPDVEAPPAPMGLRAVAGPGAVLLEWEPVVAGDLAGYAVYREDGRSFAAVATGLRAPRYLDEGLRNGRAYRYEVSALDAQANESERSAPVAARPSAEAAGRPPEIAALEEGAEPGRPIVMIRNAAPLDVEAELTYTVQVSTEADFSTIVDRGGLIAESPSGTTRWRLARALDPQAQYWFRVRAFDGRFEGPWSEPRALRPADAMPASNSEDFDGDGLVGFRDFFLLANGYGSTDAVLDLDRGGRVGAEDLRRLRARFGQTVPGKRLGAQRVAVAPGSQVEIEARAVSAERVVVRLRLRGVRELSGYGFRLVADPPILVYEGRLDSTLFGGRGASLELVRAGDGELAIGEHLRGRQPNLDVSGGWEVRLLFGMRGVPRDVELRLEEGFLGAGRGRMLRVEQAGHARIVPQVYALYANYPNPFNPATAIPLAIPPQVPGLPRPPASLSLYNALGQLVRHWDLSQWQPGFHTLVWDGRDERGREMASGLYLLRLRAGEFARVRKVLLLR